MSDNRIRLTHPQKKGVVAKVSQDQLQAHLDDGWSIEGGRVMPATVALLRAELNDMGIPTPYRIYKDELESMWKEAVSK